VRARIGEKVVFDDHGSWLAMAELEFSFHDAQQHVGSGPLSPARYTPRVRTEFSKYQTPYCCFGRKGTKHLPRVHLSSIPSRLSTAAWRRRTSTRGTWDPRHLLDGGSLEMHGSPA
jgi:hypothetical protein